MLIRERKNKKKSRRDFDPSLDINTEYLGSIYYPNRFEETIEDSVKELDILRKNIPFDAIAFTGTSGSALAYVLAHYLKLPLICVRKPNSAPHFLKTVEGCVSAQRYLIVDDCIESGKTIKYIIDSIDALPPHYLTQKKPQPAAIFLYAGFYCSKSVFDYGDFHIPVITLC